MSADVHQQSPGTKQRWSLGALPQKLETKGLMSPLDSPLALQKVQPVMPLDVSTRTKLFKKAATTCCGKLRITRHIAKRIPRKSHIEFSTSKKIKFDE